MEAINAGKQIFISHSIKDIQVRDFFIEKFTDTNVKPVLMEYEKWSRNNKPNWMWIKDKIQRSSALFLVLTKHITKKKHTQNWVAFEIGVAATSSPQVPVVVFREQNIDFPVPYLNYYFDKPLSGTKHLLTHDISLTILNLIFHFMKQSFVHSVIRDVTKLKGHHVKCPTCLLEFDYLGLEEQLDCPCCSTTIVLDIDESDI